MFGFKPMEARKDRLDRPANPVCKVNFNSMLTEYEDDFLEAN